MDALEERTYDAKLEYLKNLQQMCADLSEKEEIIERIVLFINELNCFYNDVLNLYKRVPVSSEEEAEIFKTLEIISKKKESLQNYIWECHKEYQQRKQKADADNICITKNDFENDFKDTKDACIEEKKKEQEKEKGNNEERNVYVVEKNEDKSFSGNINTVKTLENEKNPGSATSVETSMLKNDNYADETNQVNLGKETNFPTSEGKTIPKKVTFNANVSVSEDQSYSVKAELKGHNNERKTITTIEDCIKDEIPLLSDNVIRDWSKQIDKYDNLLYEHSYEYKKNNILKQMNAKIKKTNVSNEDIFDELCLLAQEMKENLLTYQEILNEDNKVLEDTANKQLLNIDAMSEVNKKTKKLNQNKNISFFISLLIIAVSILVFMLTFAVILFL